MLINKEWGPWVKGLSTVGGTVAALTVLYRNRLTAAALLRYSQYPACYVQSIRTPDICRIKEALETLEYGQERFILLFGPTGVGKTTALSSGVAHRPGVFRVDVNHRMKADDIIGKALLWSLGVGGCHFMFLWLLWGHSSLKQSPEQKHSQCFSPLDSQPSCWTVSKNIQAYQQVKPLLC